MIFVHARNATGKTALTMKEMAQLNGESGFFEPDAGNSNEMKQAKVVMQRSRNRQLQELFPAGFGEFNYIKGWAKIIFLFLNSNCA